MGAYVLIARSADILSAHLENTERIITDTNYMSGSVMPADMI